MLRQVKTNKKIFIGPLEVAGERGMKGGNITHDSIIGKEPRSIIRTTSGKYEFHTSNVEQDLFIVK